MSSTRHASPDRPMVHERYMSDPLYVERRALNGRAVAEKAAILDDANLRRRIMLLQGISVESGGLAEVEKWIIERAPRWVGTVTMRKLGLNGSYDAEQVKSIRREMGIRPSSGQFPLKGESKALRPLEHERERNSDSYWRRMEEWERDQAAARQHPDNYCAQAFADYCLQQVGSELGKLLVELCLNPSITCESFPWLDLASALAELETEYGTRINEGTVETSITRKVWQSVERAREVHRSAGPVPRHIVIVEGVEGVGKTSAAKAKCCQHLGEMRFVPLLGNVNLKDFFRAVSRACGLPHGENLKAEQMKINVENFLRLTRMILVIDEAHRLFPDGNRVYAAPALMNWIYMLAELKAPVVMLVTPQFATRMDTVENCTDWRSGQLKRRVRSYERLPEKLTARDLEAIAESRFPQAAAGIIDEVVGYAGSTRYQIDAIHNIAEDAFRFAAEAGRERPTFIDLQRAIDECARPTYTALTTKRDRDILNGVKSRRGGKSRAAAAQRQDDGSEAAPVLPGRRSNVQSAPTGADNLHAESPTENRLRGFDLAGV